MKRYSVIYNKLTYVLIGIVLVFSNGCVKDEIVVEAGYDRPVNVAAPVFKAFFKAADIVDRIDDEHIFIDDDGLLIAQISDTSYTITFDEIISLDEINIDKVYNIVSSPATKSSEQQVVFYDTIPMQLTNGQRIDSMKLKNGKITISVDPPGGVTGTWTVSFPQMVSDNGEQIIFTGSLSRSEVVEEDMAGAFISFLLNNENKSLFEMVTTVDFSGVPTTPNFKLSFNMSNTKPEYLFGYLGVDTIMRQGKELPIDLMDIEDLDMLDFNDIRFYTYTKSFVGAPTLMSLDTVFFINTDTDEELSLEIPNNNTISLESAIYNSADNTATPFYDSLMFNKSNSNIYDIIKLSPNQLVYSISEIINPEGDTGKDNFLINDGNTSISGRLILHIPVWFRSDNYEINDTADFDIRDIIEDSSDIDYLEYLNLNFKIENGFPFSIYSQGYIVDKNMTVLDSIFDDETHMILKSPPVNDNDEAVGVENTEFTVTLDHDEVKELYDNHASNIIIISKLCTGDSDNPEFVKVFSNYKINLRMSFEVKSSDNIIDAISE